MENALLPNKDAALVLEDIKASCFKANGYPRLGFELAVSIRKTPSADLKVYLDETAQHPTYFIYRVEDDGFICALKKQAGHWYPAN